MFVSASCDDNFNNFLQPLMLLFIASMSRYTTALWFCLAEITTAAGKYYYRHISVLLFGQQLVLFCFWCHDHAIYTFLFLFSSCVFCLSCFPNPFPQYFPSSLFLFLGVSLYPHSTKFQIHYNSKHAFPTYTKSGEKLGQLELSLNFFLVFTCSVI